MRVFDRLLAEHPGHRCVDLALALEAPFAPGARLALSCPPADAVAEVAMAAMLRGYAVGMLDPTWTERETAAAMSALDPQVVLDAEGVGDLVAQTSPATGVERRDVRAAAGEVSGEQPFYIGFTSGSSGRPKGFVRSHRSWWTSFVGFDELFAIGSGDRVLVPGPLASSHFFFGAMHALHAGADLEVIRFDADSVIDRLLEATSRVYVVPTMLAAIVDRATERGIERIDVASVFCAGARLEPALRAAVEALVPDGALIEYYGASELSFVSIHRSGSGVPSGSVGRAFPGVTIQIYNDHADPCAVGETGTVYVSSDLVFSGYLEPESDAGIVRRGHALTVGDRGHLDADGYLYVAGRGSSVIITGGSNVQAEEVEAALVEAPGVRQAIVFGVDDPRWGQIVACAVVCEPGAPVDRRTLREHMRTRLAPYKRPRRYFGHLGPLPLTASGKIARDEVGAAVAAGRLREL